MYQRIKLTMKTVLPLFLAGMISTNVLAAGDPSIPSSSFASSVSHFFRNLLSLAWGDAPASLQVDSIEKTESRALRIFFGKTPQSIAYIHRGIFLSSARDARNTELLQHLEITHVVNATGYKSPREGSELELRHPPANFPDLIGGDDHYLQVPIEDNINVPYEEFYSVLTRTLEFISSSQEKNPEAKIIVHCEAGISRSSSLVIGFLMSKGLSFLDAFAFVLEKKSNIAPNIAFVSHLLRFERELAHKRILPAEFKSQSSYDLLEHHAASLKKGGFYYFPVAEIRKALLKHKSDDFTFDLEATIQELEAREKEARRRLIAK